MRINPLILFLPLLPILGPFGYLVLGISKSARYISINIVALLVLFLVCSLLIILFIFYENFVFIRTAVFIIGIVFAKKIIFRLPSVSVEKIIEAFFLINIGFIVLEIALYNFGITIFSTSGRFGGLMGYDFVAFLMGTYLLYTVGGREKYNLKILLTSSFAVAATILSGRFGVVVLGSVGLALIIIKRPNIRFYMASFLVVILAVKTFGDQLIFAVSTLKLFLTSEGAVAEAYGALDTLNNKGYYSASPVTWLYEFMSAFTSWPAFLMPQRSFTFVDSGPAFLTINGGLFLMVFYYVVTALVLLPKRKLQWALLLVWLLVDLKFRCLLSPFPTIWMLLLFASMRQMHQQALSRNV